MKVTITIEGQDRNYQGDFHKLYNKDWTDEVQGFMNNVSCDHVCTSDCRRDGCDKHGCTCGGEWHNEK